MMWILGLSILGLKIVFVLGAVLGLAAYLVLLERVLLGRFQIRYGPNRVGPYGLFQPIADGIKLLLKEDFIPEWADRGVYLLAPAVVAATALLMFAVVPFGPDLVIAKHVVPMVISDINVGLLYVLALSSLGVYGVALGGWASTSKFALLGSIRGAAQMISYELALGLSIVPVVMMAGSLSLVDIVNAQSRLPYIFVQPLAFVIFIVSALAESKRIPFDMPEADTELGAGFNTEYSGMRFGLFFLGEYVHMQVLGALIAVFFLGGWHGPFFPPIIWLFIKIIIVCMVMIWIRATLPRFRYDQLMDIGWKVLIPAGLANILITGLFLI
ncbi:NADH-quinone oxidoreductase subunit NuoH [uncultured Desulfobacter sp.]|uniref:NADH-quinone oxidoreductase subunit NuoH n=1 Tax=uncultured Desulfobacter sp. TaxID=240139 RepID=UPI002AAA6491|nr:NADH-quinone oxidoreductase subunit NuoH [uncultured Desulfobacter sp.]